MDRKNVVVADSSFSHFKPMVKKKFFEKIAQSLLYAWEITQGPLDFRGSG